ncbi:hypothetical protein HUJ04_004363 [Dendroctonus ponderosae]|nr:hypothetical protein HUJ04_004363 [Dendroctonus ponderosae]KAH1014567.1 hypothetical protein HUJ05_012420 [Dendroctonus ponderosae]
MSGGLEESEAMSGAKWEADLPNEFPVPSHKRVSLGTPIGSRQASRPTDNADTPPVPPRSYAEEMMMPRLISLIESI